jgi:hypothetical protein
MSLQQEKSENKPRNRVSPTVTGTFKSEGVPHGRVAPSSFGRIKNEKEPPQTELSQCLWNNKNERRPHNKFASTVSRIINVREGLGTSLSPMSLE